MKHDSIAYIEFSRLVLLIAFIIVGCASFAAYLHLQRGWSYEFSLLAYGATSAVTAWVVAPQKAFQRRVDRWMLACFGSQIAADAAERNHRFIEESLELAQACGMSKQDAYALVDYVYGRPIGEKVQEVGGVAVTLSALCSAQGIDMRHAGELELARVWTKIEQIRAKQAEKPKQLAVPMVVLCNATNGE